MMFKIYVFHSSLDMYQKHKIFNKTKDLKEVEFHIVTKRLLFTIYKGLLLFKIQLATLGFSEGQILIFNLPRTIF